MARRKRNRGPGSLPYPPDFQLAPMRRCDRWCLLKQAPSKPETDEEIYSTFMLSLALAFNDLKGTYYIHWLSGKYRQLPEYTAQWGNLAGMRLQLIRTVVGIIHELLKLVCDTNDVIKSTPLQNILASIPDEARKAWDDIADVAFDTLNTTFDGPASNLKSQLWRLRIKMSFHYDRRDLAQGYRAFFSDASKSPYNDAAC